MANHKIPIIISLHVHTYVFYFFLYYPEICIEYKHYVKAVRVIVFIPE